MSSLSESSTTTTAAEERSARVAVTLFPVLILAGGAVALAAPSAFTGLAPWINPLLGVIMFGMGLTLTPLTSPSLPNDLFRW